MPKETTITPLENTTALILAGGAGTRVGGRDKGLIEWRGKRLVQQVCERIAPQVGGLLISCNRHREQYANFSPLAPADLREDFQGPLAGLEAAQAHLSSDLVLLAPCDAPLLPLDLAQRLNAELQRNGRLNVVYATTGNDGHYLCALLRRSVLQGLPAYLDAGNRSVHRWYAGLGAGTVSFDDQPESFLNLNQIS
ncbi:molybdenum cofactor guanylyltransferase MobA [Haliea sp. E17]|uniref:molybdenum cofactor guanylyltransferase MobA n=1 Tax=Haliea sp. E17 TaxID=3401576 RepID=UPI003AAEC96D